ncbi:19579_t:CDS:1 [Funneliformis geosporum]|uniref:19427_t:CDS:1 n=1 Tax=Funneliformis geosporum TaxID=1117311 RepID=A0A9W4WLE9_9GLOM|nr:19579_t:CDS:1 [Funneliformis geosporum]CAI2170284.1 19427_t:CDS:1 [Funneliformis geosporum]
MARLTSTPVNENNNNTSTTTTTTTYHLNARLNFNHIESNPLLKSLYDQVDSMLQQPSGQEITKLFYVVLSAIDKNFSNPNSPLSMNSEVNNLRQLFNTPNDRMRLTLTFLRLPQQSRLQSNSSDGPLASNLLPPHPETWSDTTMTPLVDQVIKEEELEDLSSAFGNYR